MGLDLFDKLIKFAKEKIDIMIWICLTSGILIFAPVSFLNVLHIDNFGGYANIIIGLFFLMSATMIITRFGFAIKKSIDKKNKSTDLKNLETDEKTALLSKLEELYDLIKKQ